VARGKLRITISEGRLMKKRWIRKTWEMLETCETREMSRGGSWSEPGERPGARGEGVRKSHGDRVEVEWGRYGVLSLNLNFESELRR
jgi:hypothetical protein